MSLLKSESAQNWLRQFSIADQPAAAALLSRFVLVSRDEFAAGLRALVIQKAKKVNGPIGLYAERALPRERRDRFGPKVALPLFNERQGRVRRAMGNGPAAVEPVTPDGHEVASEGIIGQLITQLCRENEAKFISHPGPDAIRRHKVRRLWVLTDLIGSGSRAVTYLDAAWQVASVRSWWSGKLLKLGVVAYSSTEAGLRRARRHRSKPVISTVMPCPTIKLAFGSDLSTYWELCEKYDPVAFKPANPLEARQSLGYQNTGALIAFAHGAPNNIPNIFFCTGDARPNWVPLFPARVTSGVPNGAFGRSLSAEAIAERLELLGQRILAKSPAAATSNVNVKKRLLVLAALTRSNRNSTALAYATGLTLPEIRTVRAKLLRLGWIDKSMRLTDQGHSELRQAKRHARSIREPAGEALDGREIPLYYPKSLRPPVRNI